jgi:hypothetical protein
MPRRKPEAATKRPPKTESRIDEEIEDSFPASDPPSFAGGCHAVGNPRRPKERKNPPRTAGRAL